MVKRFLSVLFVLFVLFSLTPLKSLSYASTECQTCSKSNCCGVPCSSNQSCVGDRLYGCACVQNTSPPNPPTPTDRPEASPTTGPGQATPTPGGARCNNITPRSACDTPTNYCMITYCGCTCNNGVLQNCRPRCSAICQNGYCYVTQPTTTPNPSWTDIACDPNGWGPWSACTCDKGRYEGCSSTNYCGQVRFCNDPGSNHYQINCCIL